MEIKNIEKLLTGTQWEPFVGTLQKITLEDYTYDDLFKMGNDHLGFFAIKARKSDQQNIIDSLNSLETIKDTENFINKNIEIIEKDKTIITVSKWLNGKQPVIDNRDTLPKFFSKLAFFNRNNIVNGHYTSMYLDCKYFDSAIELIDYELNYHKKYFSENFNTKILMEVMVPLKHGIFCIINEDMNCGNFVITDDGEYKIVDTDWIIKGINLYQFQHIDYFGFDEKKWYKITGEAKDCYEAYFETLGIPIEEANEQIRSIELLNALRENTFLKYSWKGNDEEMERRIKIILEKDKYI